MLCRHRSQATGTEAHRGPFVHRLRGSKVTGRATPFGPFPASLPQLAVACPLPRLGRGLHFPPGHRPGPSALMALDWRSPAVDPSARTCRCRRCPGGLPFPCSSAPLDHAGCGLWGVGATVPAGSRGGALTGGPKRFCVLAGFPPAHSEYRKVLKHFTPRHIAFFL